MSDNVKISKAFDAFMADSGSNDKRDAIVIYRTPRDGTLPSDYRGVSSAESKAGLHLGPQGTWRSGVVEDNQG